MQVWHRVTSQGSVVWPQGDDVLSVERATFGSSLALSPNGHFLLVGAPTWSCGDESLLVGLVQIFDSNKVKISCVKKHYLRSERRGDALLSAFIFVVSHALHPKQSLFESAFRGIKEYDGR